MERQKLHIPVLMLGWSQWVAWDRLILDARKKGGVRVPSGMPGVYEVKYAGARERLTIGRASNLRMRIKQGLVKGKVPHSAGKKIRGTETVSKLFVRWAVTERRAAAEEELHRRHRRRFGRLPKYVAHT